MSSSSSSDEEARSLLQEIINKLPVLDDFLSKVKDDILKSEPQNAGNTTDSNTLLFCCNTNQAQPDCSPSPAALSSVNPKLFNRVEKLERDIKYVERAHTKLKDLEKNVSPDQTLKQLLGILGQMRDNFLKFEGKPNDVLNEEDRTLVSSLEEMLTEKRHKIQSLQRKADPHGSGAGETVVGTTFDAYYLVGEKPSEDMKNKIQESSAFLDFYKDLLEVFLDLKIETKLCLLCFSVFPEKAVVKKRALLQWWIGEGFVDPNSDATDILQDIVARGFIEPELENRRLVGFKMDPLVRLVVVRIAEVCGFLSFNEMGVPADDFSWSHRACLVVRGKASSRKQLTRGEHQEKSGGNQENSAVHLEKLHTLFNVNDPYPDFKKEWFSKLKNLNALCLGGWQGSAGQHIEIEDTEFLDALENMKYLKFLSLQGISRVTELPRSICKLKNLLILDLKACHNLEALPKSIAALKNLTHLDVSECYLLDHIPKGVASLLKLQVLKGFLIGQSTSRKACGLKALAALTKLRKLSINTARQDFPTEDEVQDLQRLKSLENLNITWRGKPSGAQTGKSSWPERACGVIKECMDGNRAKREKRSGAQTGKSSWPERACGVIKKCMDGNRAKREKSSAQPTASAQLTEQPASDPQSSVESTSPHNTPASAAATNPEESKNLQKLELQCFPGTAPPVWLINRKLKPKKKLYISGGNLQSLRPDSSEDTTWEVQILRLRYLKQLWTDYSELKKKFPQLIYLEKIECPKLTLFPCDEDGVWLNQASKLEDSTLGLSWSFLKRRKTKRLP